MRFQLTPSSMTLDDHELLQSRILPDDVDTQIYMYCLIYPGQILIIYGNVTA